MNVTGKLLSKENAKSGVGASGKQWAMIKFTVAQKGFKEQTELDLTAFGTDVVQFISDTTIGTVLLLDVVVQSKDKEWNGKTWRSTEVKCLRAETVRENEVVTHTDHKGVQQMAQMHNQQYQRAKDTSWQEPNFPNDDQLPF